MSTSIASVFAWEALDSRGNPTVACEVRLRGGATGTATAPSGASTGAHEAHELRDGQQDRYRGKGVSQAVANVNGPLAQAVIGKDSGDQATVDGALRAADGSANLSRLGANALLAVSLASLQAAAAAAGQPLWRYAAADGRPAELPLPMINILSGGAHAGRAVDIQDVLVMPTGASNFAQALEWVDRVRAATAAQLHDMGHATALVADEGGYGPALPTNRTALEVVTLAIERAGFRAGTDMAIALDIAANQFFDATSQRYVLAAENRRLTATQWAAELAQWAAAFPVISIEDGMAEDDWEGWVELTDQLGARIQIVGDDLFTTDVDRLAHGANLGAANAVLVKPNQIGTVSDAHAFIRAAQDCAYATVLSARSGETEESWLADLAVGWRTGQIKVGSLARSERTAKWNRLLRLQAELSGTATFAGKSVIAPLGRR